MNKAKDKKETLTKKSKIINKNKIKQEHERVYYFDNLKFLLILLVVIGHCVESAIKSSIYAKSIFIFIYTFHMPLFVFVSGFFAKNSIKNNNKNKIVQYFILYVLLYFLTEVINCIKTGVLSFSLFNTSATQWYLLAMCFWYILSILTKNMNKKYLLIFSIFISLIIGYDKSINDFLVLSRTIVYYPFFLLGLMCNKEQIFKITDNKKNKYISIVILIIYIFICTFLIDYIYKLRPMFTGRNPYSVLNSYENFGLFFRLITYIISFIICLCIMCIIPNKKISISKLGSRTFTVYFLHKLIIKIIFLFDIKFKLYQLIIIGVLVTFILSIKIFSKPFDMFFKVNFFNKNDDVC
ncbi:MAG: acyltransferase family protein [Bacilli bacterium]